MSFKNGDNMPFMSTEGSRKPRYPDVIFSRREQAMIIPKTLRGGFGPLKPGTLLCEATYDGTLVPYIPTDPLIVAGDAAIGKAFLVADYASAATVCYIGINDSYRFVVGENLIGVRNNGGTAAYIDYGVLSAIDRTTEPHRAKLTMTGVADAAHTAANKAAVYPKAAAASKFNKPLCVLDEFIDTGTGPEAVGALASVIVGNAMLVKNLLIAYDAQAVTDLAPKDWTQYIYLS